MPEPARITRARITHHALSVDALVAAVRDPRVGGIATFLGVVRNHDQQRPVTALTYTAHPSAEQGLRGCLERVVAGHEVVAVAAEHRIGSLTVGDLAVVIAVGAAHRAEALTCCRAVIDAIKVEVPIWKEQAFADGTVDWVGL